jgi:hypothetical protein
MANHPNRARAAATAGVDVLEHNHDADYARLLVTVSDVFTGAAGPLFTTNAADLFARYLDKLPAEREIHSCSACRRFIETFGGLVTIGDDGRHVSAIWDVDAAPSFYRPAIKAMASEVLRARVTGPFLSNEHRYGTPKTGPWTHFAVTPERSAVYRGTVLTAGQAMAAKREDFRTVASALADFTPPMLTEALRLLEAASLARSERFIAPVRWLLDLHTARADAKDSRVRDNLLWRAVATAPEGYCHPRSSMIGSLLEDIAAGLDFADVKRRFDSKMHPLQYQRPQAAPTAGAIAAAEKVFEQMGLAPALERRFARLDEVEALWAHTAPKPAEHGAGGVFGHLAPKGHAPAVGASGMPAVTMTWEKFARTVLPGATAIEAMVPARGNFLGMTTAVHADAPPLLRWDRDDRRNPVAWYLWHGGSTASQWGLSAGWRKVSALTLLPTMWGPEPAPHLGEGVVVILDGALDTRDPGAALFPETIRQELHGVRAVIEAYSKRATLGPPGGPAACGLDLRKGANMDSHLRVTSATGKTDYRIDRWD